MKHEIQECPECGHPINSGRFINFKQICQTCEDLARQESLDRMEEAGRSMAEQREAEFLRIIAGQDSAECSGRSELPSEPDDFFRFLVSAAIIISILLILVFLGIRL